MVEEVVADPLPRGRLTRALATVTAGQGGTGLVTGEAGIGKTYLLHEALERAGSLGCCALYASAQDYDHGIAYAALKELLGSLERRSLDADARHELASLLAAADHAVLADPLDADTSRPQSPYVLTTRLLRALSGGGPLVIALDDAHLADDESLTALSLATRHLAAYPILLLFAVRPDKWGPGTALAATVGRLVDGEHGFAVEVRPLEREGVEEALSKLLNGRADDELVSYIYAQSRGNPLFVRETLRSLQAADAIREAHGTYYLTEHPSPRMVTRRGALLHRVFQQDQHSRELARVLSAFGRVHLDYFSLLSELTSMSTERVQAAFDSLSEAGILAPGRVGWYEFTHPLMAEVLYEDLGPLERRRLHRAISEYVRDNESAVRMGLLEWARHVTEGASPGDRHAIDAALQAAATTRHAAPLSAARWYQRALDLLPPDAPEAPLLLARQTVAYWKGSRPEFALEVGRSALDTLPPGRLYATTAASVVNATYAMGRLGAALELLTEAIPQVDEATPFVAQRALILAHLGNTEEARVQASLARAAVTSSAPEDQVIAYSYLGHTENAIGHYDGVATAVTRLAELASSGKGCLPPAARLSALESGSYVLSRAGSLRKAREMLSMAADLGPRTGCQDIGGQIGYATAMTEFLAGQWSRALETIRAEAVRLEFSGLAKNLAWLRLIEAHILLERGKYGAAAGLLDDNDPSPEWAIYLSVSACVRAQVALARKEYGAAFETLRAQRDLGAQRRWRDVSYHALESLASGYLEAGETREARRAADELGELADETGMPKIRWAAGLARALAYRSPDPALETLDQAETEGLRFVEARAHYTLGALGRDQAAHLNRALALFCELGAPVWEKLVLSCARATGVTLVRGCRRSHGPSHLTDTERQLVQLVRDGLSNREISQVLHYSGKTVEAYLTRLYRKTGCRSRVELVVALERGGLAPLSETGTEQA